MYWRLSLIIGIFIVWLMLWLRSLRFWNPDEAIRLWTTESYDVSAWFFSWLQNMTGIVILQGPRSDTRQRRSSLMGQNTQYMRWRLYDLTDKKAKPWLKNVSLSSWIQLIMEVNKFQQFGNDFKGRTDYYTGSHVKLLSDQKLGVNFVHAKTFVGEKWRAIQTANLTHSSLTKNIEHFVLWIDTRVRDDLLQLFALDQQTILSNGKKNKKWYADWIQYSSPNLLVCPLNCRAKMEYLINNAQKSIRISAQYVTDQRIIAMLDKKQLLDLRIRSNDTVDNYPLRDLLGPKVVNLQKTPYSHDKMLIIDGKYLMIGSMNFSDNALDNNREIGIILTDPKLIQQVEKEF